jgi:hypothetical protein
LVLVCKYPDKVPNRIPHHLNFHRKKEVVPSDISRNPVQEEDIPLDKESIRMVEVEVAVEDRVGFRMAVEVQVLDTEVVATNIHRSPVRVEEPVSGV